jgi:hypothetical protein
MKWNWGHSPEWRKTRRVVGFAAVILWASASFWATSGNAAEATSAIERAKRAAGFLGPQLPGTAFCVDPSGFFVCPGGLSGNGPLQITMRAGETVRHLEARVVFDTDEFALCRVDASDLIPASFADARPAEDLTEVTIVGYATDAGGSSSASLSLERVTLRWSSIIPGGPRQASIAVRLLDQIRAGSAVFDSKGSFVGVVSRSGGVVFLSHQDIVSKIQTILSQEREANALAISQRMANAARFDTRPATSLPPRLAKAAEAIALLMMGSGSSASYSPAVCIDSFGTFVVAAPAPRRFETGKLSLLCQDTSGHPQRLTARCVRYDERLGLAIIQADTAQPLPSIPTYVPATAKGALYATMVTRAPSDRLTLNLSRATKVIACRSQLSWPGPPSRHLGIFSRNPFGSVANGSAILDDFGELLGWTWSPVPPGATSVLLVDALDELFERPMLSVLAPTATADTLHDLRDLEFHAIGVRRQDQATVRLSLGSGTTLHTAVAERQGSDSFAVRGVSLTNAPTSRVDYKIELLIGDAVADVHEGHINVDGASQDAVVADNQRELAEHRDVTISLPGPAAETVVGGNGRYLLVSCQMAGKIAVLDVPAASARVLDVGEGAFLFAAAAEKLVIFRPSRGELIRFDLNSLRREYAVTLPRERSDPPDQIAMASGANGPVFLISQVGDWQIRDLDAFRPLPVNSPVIEMGLDRVNCSSDGRLMAVSRGGKAINVMRWTGQHVSVLPVQTPVAINEAMPDAEGTRIYTGRGPIIMLDGGPTTRESMSEYWSPAADSAEFFLGVSVSAPHGPASATLYYAPTRRAILTVSPLQEFIGSVDSTAHRRVWLFASSNRLVSVSPHQPELIIRPLDVAAAMGAAGGDFLCVRSAPPHFTRGGSLLRYQADAISSHSGPIRYSLVGGPPGMAISDSGLLTWQVPSTASGRVLAVRLKVRDTAGVEGHQDFIVTVE